MNSGQTPLDPLFPKAPVNRLAAPLLRFLQIQSSSGLLLIACTVLALGLANSPLAEWFQSLWKATCTIGIGEFVLQKDLLHVINDGLMTIFFFVVGLEIKREIVSGELRDPKQAVLPIVAALGGMVVPALVYILSASMASLPLEVQPGWAIPMATDIAFVVGVLTLFGDRVSTSLKVLLLTLAIVDDLGAVLVIAFVFTESIDRMALMVAFSGLVIALGMRAIGIRRVWLYVLVGGIVWLAVLRSGVHPTVAGVLLGLMTPSRPWISQKRLSEILQTTLSRIAGDGKNFHHQAKLLNRAEFAIREGVAPSERLESLLHPWVAFGIMPLFALANAGVAIRIEAVVDPVAITIAAGLAIGKPVGILLFCKIATLIGIARRPEQLSWGELAGGACLAGIGFTMSIFLAGIALPPGYQDAGKLGTLTGSLISSALGIVILIAVTKRTVSTTYDVAVRD